MTWFSRSYTTSLFERTRSTKKQKKKLYFHWSCQWSFIKSILVFLPVFNWNWISGKRGNVFTLSIMKLRLKCQTHRRERWQINYSNALWQSCSKSTWPRVTTEINKYLGYTSQKGQVHPISGLPPTVLPTNTP